MVHSLLILLHTGFAVASFVLGWLVLARCPRRSRADSSGSTRDVIAAMLLLITVVAVDWAGLAVTKRVAFGILCALAVYLVVRAEQARRVVTSRPPGWRKRFIGHVGFVMISLFDGFCIVSAIDLGMPVAVVVAVAVLGVVVGVLVIRHLVRRDAIARGVTDPPTRAASARSARVVAARFHPVAALGHRAPPRGVRLDCDRSGTCCSPGSRRGGAVRAFPADTRAHSEHQLLRAGVRSAACPDVPARTTIR